MKKKNLIMGLDVSYGNLVAKKKLLVVALLLQKNI